MDTLRVTLMQVDLIWENPALNRVRLNDLFTPLQGLTDLIVLPETFTTGFTQNTQEWAEELNGETITWMRYQSGRLGCALCGSILTKEHETYHNSFVFVTPEGEQTIYHKRHLFSLGGEADHLEKGKENVTLTYKGWKIQLLICYDLRFPVWCRTDGTTDLLLFSANWPKSRSLVWNTLLKARAIENQCYVAGVNRVGTDGMGIEYIGESQFVNFKGEPIVVESTAHNEESLLSTTLVKQPLESFRERFPVFRDADRFLIGE